MALWQALVSTLAKSQKGQSTGEGKKRQSVTSNGEPFARFPLLNLTGPSTFRTEPTSVRLPPLRAVYSSSFRTRRFSLLSFASSEKPSNTNTEEHALSDLPSLEQFRVERRPQFHARPGRYLLSPCLHWGQLATIEATTRVFLPWIRDRIQTASDLGCCWKCLTPWPPKKVRLHWSHIPEVALAENLLRERQTHLLVQASGGESSFTALKSSCY